MKSDHPEPDPKLAAELAAELDVALKKLPDLSAPPALLRNVMTIVQARQSSPWWQLGWRNWPLTAQITFLVAAMIMAAAVGVGGFFLNDVPIDDPVALSERLGAPSAISNLLDALMNAAALFWEHAAQPLLVYVGVIAVVSYLICVALGTLCVRLTAKRL